MRTGTADLPLHGGRAPRWLFQRMVALAREMSLAVVAEEGPHGLLRRLADPYWFQAFGCVLGFDWHSSGLTTTTCGALKEALRGIDDVGLTVAGGKGRTSRKTPQEIEQACMRTGADATRLVRASRLSAKVDSAAVQDGFQLYHHTFVFADDGSWVVVQQGMNDAAGTARRYHWFTPARFNVDPHAAVVSPTTGAEVLNLVAAEGEGNRQVATAVARDTAPATVVAEITRMRELRMPHRHELRLADLHPDRLERVLLPAYERQPEDFLALLETRGIGAKGLRALSLVAELTYGEPASVRDPASYAFAHGGKDGTPFEVDRVTYDHTIASLRRSLADARLGRDDRRHAMKRLARLEQLTGR